MPHIDPFAVVAIVLMILIAVIFLVPGEQRARRRRKKKEEEEQKDWQGACLKLERHIYALRRDIEEGQRREKILDRDLNIQKEKYARLEDKIVQERSWQQKETTDAEKKGQELFHLKSDITKLENSLAQEHGVRLRLEKSLKESQESAIQANNSKLDLEAQIARLKALDEKYRKEMSDLRAQNNLLSKKHDESTWVAKSEYQKLEKQLQIKDKELERLKEQLRREML